MLDKSKVRLGIAPIAWTNDDMPDLGKENTFEQCVSEMALAGFTGSEVGGKYPADTEVLKRALNLRGIQICNQWFSSFLISRPYEETEKEFIKATDFLKEMGAKVIGVSEQSYSIQGKMEQPVWEGKYVMDDREWKLLAEGLNKLGKIAKDKGMTLTSIITWELLCRQRRRLTVSWKWLTLSWYSFFLTADICPLQALIQKMC